MQDTKQTGERKATLPWFGSVGIGGDDLSFCGLMIMLYYGFAPKEFVHIIYVHTPLLRQMMDKP